jgi:hypothetical protein
MAAARRVALNLFGVHPTWKRSKGCHPGLDRGSMNTAASALPPTEFMDSGFRRNDEMDASPPTVTLNLFQGPGLRLPAASTLDAETSSA